MDYPKNLQQYQNATAGTQDRPNTDMEDMRDRLSIACKEAGHLAERLATVVIKLRGHFPPREGKEPSVQPVATGLVQEFRELLAGLSEAHGTARSMLDMLETSV